MSRQVFILSIFSLLLILGCSQSNLMLKVNNPEDESAAKAYISLLKQGKCEDIERDIDPSIQKPDLHEVLVKMSSLISSEEPKTTKIVGVQYFKSSDVSQVNITYEYQYSDKWLLNNVAIQKKNGNTTIIGLNVYQIPDSLENTNAFTLKNKGIIHYLFLLAVIVFPLFSLLILILCLRTKQLRRKWLWSIFIVLGVGQAAINWTTGQVQFKSLALQLFSAGASAKPYGPWIMSVSVPIGAILFLLRRRKLFTPDEVVQISPRESSTD